MQLQSKFHITFIAQATREPFTLAGLAGFSPNPYPVPLEFLSAMDGDAIPPSSPPLMGSISPQSPPFFEPDHVAFASKSSSPPPLFSSDDSRESVDITNYESPRIHKNKRKGAWWDRHESAHNSPEVKKPKFSRNLDRNFDSGVYMLSDATDSFEDLPAPHKSPFPDEADDADDAMCSDSSDDQQMKLDVPRYHSVAAARAMPTIISSPAQRAFNRQIDEGLDRNQEVYDFEGQRLQDADISRIGELKNVIRDPLINDSERPTEQQFRSFEPEIRITLNKNSLRRLVPSLFTITDLTSLSLRENEIEELPQEIRQLVRLEALYLSHNKLKYLPFDIINLLQPHGKLRVLTTMGTEILEPMTGQRFLKTDYMQKPQASQHNPHTRTLDIERADAIAQLAHLYQSLATCQDRDQTVWRIRYFESWANSFGGADEAQMCGTEKDEGFYPHHPALYIKDLHREESMTRAPRYMARTLVSYYDQTGTLLPGSPSLPCSDTEKYPVIVETNRGTYGVPSSSWFVPPASSKVSSLVTTTLTSSLCDNGEYSIPRDAELILDRAERNAAGGYGVFRECHVCRKKYVVARAEWIEFWSAGLAVFHPLKVSVCSWGCVPRPVMQQPRKHLTW